jgi:SPP1 family predicted phage head-tail adaptor
MRAGKLRQRVTIQSKTVTRSTYGEEVVTWSDLDELWASVEPLSGREFIEGQALQAAVTSKIRIRYRDTVGPTMRAVYGDHTYDILAVLPDENSKREMLLMVQEVVA